MNGKNWSNMSYDEIISGMWKDIKEQESLGNIVKFFGDSEKASVISLENLCNQPVDGLLYDLNIDPAVLMTIHKENPVEFANQMAVVNVIKFLHNFYINYRRKM